jgi:radical SAM superfamily enzyme YgiQ (UPF0313 family)
VKKILFINPSNKVDVLSSVPAFHIPPLNLLYLQHLTDNNRYDVSMCDENEDDLQDHLNKSYDLVAITCLTSNAPRAYEIADIFRKGGTPTIMGGIHVSMLPAEASNYADSIVIGEAERIWSMVLNDFENNELKRRYIGGLVQPSDIPILKGRNRGGNYSMPNILQTARGCPMDCEFCSVTKFHGGGFRSRSISDVLEEINYLKGDVLIFADDNILGFGKSAEIRARQLFKGMVERGIKKKWASQVSINIGTNLKLLRWAAKSGAKGFFIGMESLNQKVLEGMGKHFNLKVGIKRFREIIRKIHDHGIAVLGGFILGNDEDDKDVFQRTAEFVLESELDAVQYSIATPLPGTRLFERLSKEGRIIFNEFPDDWRYFDTFHVTFRPKRFDPDELIEEVSKMYSLTNKPLPAVKRAFKSLVVTRYLTGSVYLLGFNLGYWKGFRALTH